MKNKEKSSVSPIKLLLVLLILAVLTVLAFTLCRVTLRVINGAGSVLSSGESDPMFASTPEPIERPEETEIPQPEHKTLDDYVPEIETPVDRTAAQLITEAEVSGSVKN